MYEDEVDLRYYISLLLKRWYWIFLGGLIAALAAFAVSLLITPAFEATAAVAVVRSRTNVNFDVRIETLDDYQLGDTRLAADRLEALLALADSNEVVRQVLAEVGDQLQPEARRINFIRGMVESRLIGDLIEFSASHGDPEIAAAVANSWVQAYARHVNQVYGSSGEEVELLAVQVEAAEETYTEAQAALQTFLADTRVLELTRTLERDLAIKRDLLNTYQQSRVAIETNDADTSRALLNNYYAELNRIDAWLADAETLQDQVSTPSGSFASDLGDMLALIMLRGRVYGGQGPVDLQIDLADTEIEGVDTRDVRNLIDVLETRRDVTEERIAVLTAALGTDEAGDGISLVDHPLTERLETLTDDIIELETQLETEQAIRAAQRRELDAVRDRAWAAYQALSDQQLETEIQAQTTGTEVRIADLASVPDFPVNRRILIASVLSGIIGAMLAVGTLFFLDWWYRAPEHNVTDTPGGQSQSDVSGGSVQTHDAQQGVQLQEGQNKF